MFAKCKNVKFCWSVRGDFSLLEEKNYIGVNVSNNEDYQLIKKPFGPILIDAKWEILRLTKDDLRISSDVHGVNYILTFSKYN